MPMIQKPFSTALSEAYGAFKIVIDRLEPSRSKAIALTHLDTARLWALEAASEPSSEPKAASVNLERSAAAA